MSLSVWWSPQADNDLSQILDYLHHNWSPMVTIKFLDRLDDMIGELVIHPNRYPLIEERLHIRRCVITKHNSLYYRYTNDQLAILRIFDTRQDPDKLTFPTD